MKYSLFILLTGLFLFFGLPASTQKLPGLIFSRITEQNGLSDDRVQCILKDRDGFMWIGTSNGLNRYDGSAFKAFKNHNSTDKELAGNSIMKLSAGVHSNLWIATNNGLSLYNSATGDMNTWRLQGTEPDMNLFKDISVENEQYLWAATYNGLVKFDIGKKIFKRFENLYYPQGPARTALNKMNRLLDYSKNKLLLATFNGLWMFDKATEKFEPLYFGQAGNNIVINTVYCDRNNKIWFMQYGGGFHSFDAVTKEVTNPVQTVFTGGYFITAYPANNNSLLNIDHYYFDAGNNTITDILKDDQQFANNLVINAAFYSDDNLLWWGTDKGLLILDLDKSAFSTHILSDQKLTHQGIAALYRNGKMYIGAARENFLCVYDSNFQLLKKYSSVGLNNDPGAALMNIVPEQNDKLWLCSEKGIGLYDINKASVKWYKPDMADSSQPSKDFFTNLFIDSKGNHWVFPWRSGIWILDKPSGKFILKCKGFTVRNNELKKLVVAGAAEDSLGNIWFADVDEGIIKYDVSQNLFFKISDKIPILNSSAAVLEFKHPFLWTLTGGRITSINTLSNEVKQWPVPDEMSSAFAGFCLDDNGNCWLTTKKGLLFLNRKLNQFKKYTTADGLADNDLDDEIRNLGNGKLLFAKNNYVTVFSPADIRSTTARLLFTEIVSQNRQLSWHTNADGDNKLQLDHTYNNFIFKWALLNFRNPLQNLYYCKLEGVDADWKYVGNHGEAAYASLGPGKYIFRIKGSASNAADPVEDMIIVIIEPPFWKTWGFIFLTSAALLLLLIFVVRYVSTRNLKERLLRLEKEQAIEKERNRIARDMHDDLGSGLTRIAILSEVAKTQLQQPGKAMEQLQNISESSRELVDNMQDIIWVLNPKNDTLESLASYIREYALKFFEPFETAMNFKYPDEIPVVKLTEEQRRNIFLVIKESFNNIVKHANCTAVLLSLEKVKEQIVFIIDDDGKGFDTNDARRFGNGLQNMKNRMLQIGGIYAISSTTGKGTRTRVSIIV